MFTKEGRKGFKGYAYHFWEMVDGRGCLAVASYLFQRR